MSEIDGFAMSHRIILSMNSILKNDTELQDFTIVSTESNIKNKSPVLYENHSLGLESWCIKPVYQYVCDILFGERKRLADRKLSYDKMENLNSVLNGALLINPDVTTFWNMKRELVERDIITVDVELHYSKIVLSHRSKSCEAFAYRRWLLKKVMDKFSQNKIQIPPNFLQNELSLIHMASEKSLNNYHSWNHRIWCIQNIASQCAAISSILYTELNYSQEWVKRHVSEHSGYHYRQHLIKMLKEHSKIVSVFESYYNFAINKLEVLKEDKYISLLSYLLDKPNKKRILEESSSYVNYICILLYDLLVLFDEIDHLYFGHQSLYYHRRFLIHHLLRVPFEYYGTQFPKPEIVKNINLWGENIIAYESVTDLPSNINFRFLNNNVNNCTLIEIITNHEKTFISNRKDYLTKEYQKWLKIFIGFE